MNHPPSRLPPLQIKSWVRGYQEKLAGYDMSLGVKLSLGISHEPNLPKPNPILCMAGLPARLPARTHATHA